MIARYPYEPLTPPKVSFVDAPSFDTLTTHLAKWRQAHHQFLPHCIGRKSKRRDDHHVLSYADPLANTGCESVERTVRKQSIVFAVFVAGKGDERSPKCVMFGEGATREGKDRTGWVVSKAPYRCSSCQPKPITARWQRRNGASGSDVLRRRQTEVRKTLFCCGEGESSKTTSALGTICAAYFL